jgi:hypothetical protein
VVVFGTNEVQTKFGYPDASTFTDIADLATFVDLDGDSLILLAGSPANTIRIGFDGETALDECYVEYISALLENTLPEITIESTGC